MFEASEISNFFSEIKTALGGDAGPKLDVDVKQQDKIMKEEKIVII